MTALTTDKTAPAYASTDAGIRIDPRGQQFAAALTTAVLAVVLLTAPQGIGVGLLVAQTLVFALGAGLGVRATPYAWLFRTLVRPRLGAPVELEDARPPRFAQSVGLGFALAGLLGYVTGLTLLGQLAIGLAFVAALLNAAFAFCLGCEIYLLAKRLTA